MCTCEVVVLLRQQEVFIRIVSTHNMDPILSNIDGNVFPGISDCRGFLLSHFHQYANIKTFARITRAIFSAFHRCGMHGRQRVESRRKRVVGGVEETYPCVTSIGGCDEWLAWGNDTKQMTTQLPLPERTPRTQLQSCIDYGYPTRRKKQAIRTVTDLSYSPMPLPDSFPNHPCPCPHL